MNEIINLCKDIILNLVQGNYDFFKQANGLKRVSEADIKRVIHEYGGKLSAIPDNYFSTSAFEIYQYKDSSGYKVDLDLWIDNARSDLTLQVEIKTDLNNQIISFLVLDLLVM